MKIKIFIRIISAASNMNELNGTNETKNNYKMIKKQTTKIIIVIIMHCYNNDNDNVNRYHQSPDHHSKLNATLLTPMIDQQAVTTSVPQPITAQSLHKIVPVV